MDLYCDHVGCPNGCTTRSGLCEACARQVLHIETSSLRAQLKYYEDSLCLPQSEMLTALRDADPVKPIVTERVVDILKERDELRNAMIKTRTYLEERGIRRKERSTVGRTEILPMIDSALAPKEG